MVSTRAPERSFSPSSVRRGLSRVVHRLSSPYVALVAVAVAQLLVELVVMPLPRGINVDETVYVTQVALDEPAIFFAAHRARGMSYLMAPLAVFDPPFLLIRLWTILLGAGGVVLAFWPWVRRLGFGAAWAAFVFAFGWVSLYFAGEIYPNYQVAVLLVAAGGWLLAYLEDQESRPMFYAAAALFGVALIRPVDAVIGGLGLALVAFILRPRRALRPTVAMGAGGLLGVAPWIIEGMIRFGSGPLGPLWQARENTSGGHDVVNQLPLYIRNLEGPIRCVRDCRADFLADPIWYLPPERSRAMLIVMGFLALLALTYRFHHRRETRLLWLAPIVGGGITAFYAFCDCAVNLRYVLPVWAFLAILVGAGAWLLWTLPAGRWRAPVRAALVIAAIVFAGWQATHGSNTMSDYIRSRERARVIAQILDERSGETPCAAAVQYSYPQIQYWSDCLVVPLHHGNRGWLHGPVGSPGGSHDLAKLAEEGYRVFAVNKSRLPENSPVREWHQEDISSDVLGTYILYILPDGRSLYDVVPNTTASPPDGEDR